MRKSSDRNEMEIFHSFITILYLFSFNKNNKIE